MPNDPLDPPRCAVVLAALAAPERLNIVRFLADGPRNVTEIAEMLGCPPVNVAHHMNTLRNARLVDREKRGRFALYSLRPGVLAEVVEAGVPKAALDLGCCEVRLPITGGHRRCDEERPCGPTS